MCKDLNAIGTDSSRRSFPRSSTLLSDDIEKFIDNDDDACYMAWKAQLEKPHRITKVRGLRSKSTDLISGHLLPSKTMYKGRNCVDGSTNNERNNSKYNNRSSANHLIDFNANYHLNDRFNMSKDRFMPYLSQQFNRMNIVQPALHKVKKFMHFNAPVPAVNTYQRYDIVYPPNLIAHTPHNCKFVIPNVYYT